jgi:hypothetical protein
MPTTTNRQVQLALRGLKVRYFTSTPPVPKHAFQPGEGGAQLRVIFLYFSNTMLFFLHKCQFHCLGINPLSAMVAIWHHIIVSFKSLAQKGLLEFGYFGCNASLISERFNCGKECLLIGGCRLNGLRGMSSPCIWGKSGKSP